jgi:hypothetical protein
MWRHIDPDRLLQGAQGGELLNSECDHLVSCDICQELLIFLQEHMAATPSSEPKAA